MADNAAETLPDKSLESQEIDDAQQYGFKPGNKLGAAENKSGHLWSKEVKRREFRRTIQRVIAIRDGRIREMDFTENGKRIWVYPSVQNLIKACEIMLGYTAGKPAQRIDIDIAGDSERPNTLQIVLNRPATKQERKDASRQIIELANSVDDTDEQK